MSVSPKPLQVAFILFEGEVARMHIGNDDGPLIPRQLMLSDVSLCVFDATDSAEGEGSGVTWIMQHL